MLETNPTNSMAIRKNKIEDNQHRGQVKKMEVGRTGLFDLNHLIYDFFYFRFFLITDLYEFNTNNCLQASRSTKFCMFLIQNTKCAHLCSCIVTR